MCFIILLTVSVNLLFFLTHDKKSEQRNFGFGLMFYFYGQLIIVQEAWTIKTIVLLLTLSGFYLEMAMEYLKEMTINDILNKTFFPLRSGPNFIELLKHEKVLSTTKLCLPK